MKLPKNIIKHHQLPRTYVGFRGTGGRVLIERNGRYWVAKFMNPGDRVQGFIEARTLSALAEKLDQI